MRFGAPAAVTDGEPEPGVAAAEGDVALGGAGEGGDLRRREKREDAELNVFGEVGEGEWIGFFVGIGIGIGIRHGNGVLGFGYERERGLWEASL